MPDVTVAVRESVAEHKQNYRLYYGLIFLTACVSVFLAFTCQPKADEGYLYLPAFEQAYAKWPYVDMSPYWPVSSFYLWLIASLQAVTGTVFGPQFISIGRIVSLLCWLAVVVDLLRTGREKGLIVLFNPYVLVYANRAHPFVPSILLFYLFWLATQRNRRVGLLWLPLAVNFQVYMAGVVGLFTPTWPLRSAEFWRAFGLGLLVVAGVGLTFLTWSGIYPENFTKHHFYLHYQKQGTPTFQYIASVLLLAGLNFWVVGERSVAQMRQHGAYSLAVIAAVVAGSLWLFWAGDIVSVVREVSVLALKTNYQMGWVGIYALAGLGWLRLHRNHYMVFFGLLVSALTLVSLHYFYERLSIFAFVAPCLAWCWLEQTNSRRQAWLRLTVYVLFLACSIVYQRYGSL